MTTPQTRPTQTLRTLFTDHPDSVDETYVQHAGVAFGFAGWLFLASLAALVHAVLPFLCVSTASTILDRLHTRMHNRHST